MKSECRWVFINNLTCRRKKKKRGTNELNCNLKKMSHPYSFPVLDGEPRFPVDLQVVWFNEMARCAFRMNFSVALLGDRLPHPVQVAASSDITSPN